MLLLSIQSYPSFAAAQIVPLVREAVPAADRELLLDMAQQYVNPLTGVGLDYSGQGGGCVVLLLQIPLCNMRSVSPSDSYRPHQ